jgi:hypothetical protein
MFPLSTMGGPIWRSQYNWRKWFVTCQILQVVQSADMLECRVTETVFQTRPVFHGPSVYLEQWAYAMFSRQPEQRQAFVEALAERGVTLALGRLNLLEFSRVTVSSQVRAAEEFVPRHAVEGLYRASESTI